MRHHRNARLTVEQCLPFDVGSLKDALRCVDFPTNSGETSCSCISVWSDSSGRTEAVLRCFVGRTESEGLLVLTDPEGTSPYPDSVRLSGEYIISVDATRPFIGGVRYWFRCPVEHDGRPCGRRVKKLYLPPGEQIFGCRYCHDLTYRSCQEHDNRKAVLSRDPDALEAALGSNDLKRAVLGIGALALSVKKMRKGQPVANTPQDSHA